MNGSSFSEKEVGQEKAQRWSQLKKSGQEWLPEEIWGMSGYPPSSLAPVIALEGKIRPPAENQGITELTLEESG